METGKGKTYKWNIENLSHCCAEVHGHCIRSPEFTFFPFINSYMELYPKGIGGQGERLVVRLCGTIEDSFSGELSFYSSDGSLLCSKQQVNAEKDTDFPELPPGPKFVDVLSRIRKSEDFITVKLRVHDENHWVERVCTTVNGFKISVKMNPRWVETIKSGETNEFCYIQFSSDDDSDGMELSTCSENDIVHFMIDPQVLSECYPFAVEMCMSLTGSDDNAVSCLKNEHVFRDDSPWTFPDSLQKKELVGKEMSLFLWVKTKNVIQRPSYVNWDYSNVSVELNNICFSEKAPSTDHTTSHKVEAVTKDSGSHTSLTSVMPDDSVLVLSKELMCIYQDQDLSDIPLKCDNVTFPVHKVILSARSPVFKSMLSTDMAEAASGEVDIGDLDPSTLSRFVTYLYTGAVEEDLQCERALKLYYAADKYQVPSLKRDCSKFLCANVSVSNVCDILSLADKHRDDQLTSVAQEFILVNFNDVLKSDEWESFMCRESLLAVKTVTHFATKDSVVRKHESK